MAKQYTAFGKAALVSDSARIALGAGAIDQLLAQHRLAFGTATMTMPDPPVPTPPAPPVPTPTFVAPPPPAGDAGTGAKVNNEHGFPDFTPVAEMTSEQRSAYDAFMKEKNSRQWLQRTAGVTLEELKEIRDKAAKHDELERELMSDKDRAVTDAKQAAETAAAEKYRPMLVDTAFRVAIGDRKSAEEIEELLGDLNLASFLKDDGSVNTAKVLARVEQFAPVTGNQQQRRGPTPTGQGVRGGSSTAAGSSIPGGSVASGRDLYRDKHGRKSA